MHILRAVVELNNWIYMSSIWIGTDSQEPQVPVGEDVRDGPVLQVAHIFLGTINK